MQLSSDGKYIITAEGGYICIWNLKNQVVLSKIQQGNVVQLLEVNVSATSIYVAAISHQSCNKTETSTYRLVHQKQLKRPLKINPLLSFLLFAQDYLQKYRELQRGLQI